MTLYHRLRRRLGYGVTLTLEYERDVYHYTVEHLNGEVSEDRAHEHRWNDAALTLLEADDDTWAAITVREPHVFGAMKPAWGTQGYGVVRELEGVQEVTHEKVAEDTWTLTVDRAEDDIVDVTRERTEVSA